MESGSERDIKAHKGWNLCLCGGGCCGGGVGVEAVLIVAMGVMGVVVLMIVRVACVGVVGVVGVLCIGVFEGDCV